MFQVTWKRKKRMNRKNIFDVKEIKRRYGIKLNAAPMVFQLQPTEPTSAAGLHLIFGGRHPSFWTEHRICTWFGASIIRRRVGSMSRASSVLLRRVRYLVTSGGDEDHRTRRRPNASACFVLFDVINGDVPVQLMFQYNSRLSAKGCSIVISAFPLFYLMWKFRTEEGRLKY